MARGRHGPLSAAELAEAAVLGDVALVLSFAGWLLPFPLVFFAAATVPFAALTVRRRLRAVVIATVASGQVAFLLGGFTLEINHILVALLGLAVGLAYRWGWGNTKAALFAIPLVWLVQGQPLSSNISQISSAHVVNGTKTMVRVHDTAQRL